VNNLYSVQSVHGPMARNVPDLALYLDTMAGFCPHDPQTFDAPAVSFSAGLANPALPKRVAVSIDFNGMARLDREVREICGKAMRRFEELGCIVEEAAPDFGPVDEVSGFAQPALRRRPRAAAASIATRSSPTSSGTRSLGSARASRLAQASASGLRTRRMVAFFQKYDSCVALAPTAAFDVNLRAPKPSAAWLDNYMVADRTRPSP
jgi:amidase